MPTAPQPLTGGQLPVTLGHEFAGTVTEVGDGVEQIAEGDRVTIEPVYRCDQCPPCRAGNYNVCQQIGFHGLMADGGMAQYTVVEARMVHKLPDAVSLELGGLVEPMAVAYHAARRGNVGTGDTAVEGMTMQIPKEMVVERIRNRVDAETAARAESELPDKIDPAADAELLRGFGLDPAKLERDVPGTPGVG